jgi:ArsR family transcriptional regulator, arsenate/arsenite/antimonite-responsive transcriptional repressor
MVIELTMPRWAPAHEADAVDLLAAATEPTRWRILATLASAGTRCACEIEPVANVAPNVLSYHLKVLREAGLVTSARRGKWIDYTIAADAAERLARALPTALPGARGEES